MLFIRFFAAVLILLGTFVFSGCAQLDTYEANLKAKEFRVSRDLSNIYIFRDSFWGKLSPKYVWIDGKYIAKTKGDTFILKRVKPGEHMISSKSEFNNTHLFLVTRPGRNYYIRQSIFFGAFVDSSKLSLVSAKEAQEAILDADMDLLENQSNPRLDLNAEAYQKKFKKMKEKYYKTHR